MANHTAVGVAYVLMGAIGIGENSLAAILIGTDREMRNPTYVYMVNLCLCDAVTLIPLAIYSGIVLIFPSAATNIFLVKLSSYITALSWAGACQFIVLMSFSRYVQLKWSHKMHQYFKRRNLIVTILAPWLIGVLGYSWLLFFEPTPFAFFPDRCAWLFVEAETVGRAYSFLTMAMIATIALIVNFLNIRTLLHVHKMRTQVHTIETRANAVREIKLFAQSAITGLSFTIAAITYFVVSALKDQMNTVAFVISHSMWILNAMQYPVIYFAMNGLLRERFMNLIRRQPSNRVESVRERMVKKEQSVQRRKCESARVKKTSINHVSVSKF